MEVRILPSSNQHYVGNMQQSSGSLTWDSAGIGWTLMVRSAYGEPIGIDDAIVRQLQIRGASLVNGPDGYILNNIDEKIENLKNTNKKIIL